MSLKISTTKTTANDLVWWRFEKNDFAGYTNNEKQQFEAVYQQIDDWWIFSSINPRYIMSDEEAVDYYKNLAVFIAKNCDSDKIPDILRQLNWVGYITSMKNMQITFTIDDNFEEFDGFDHFDEFEAGSDYSDCNDDNDLYVENPFKRGRGRPLGSKNKPKAVTSAVRRSYRIIAAK
jgi:hypothetical protein